MSKEVFVDFSGIMKLNSKTTFTKIGLDQSLEEVITAEKWSALSDEDRKKYILTHFTDASRQADEFDIKKMHFRIE